SGSTRTIRPIRFSVRSIGRWCGSRTSRGTASSASSCSSESMAIRGAVTAAGAAAAAAPGLHPALPEAVGEGCRPAIDAVDHARRSSFADLPDTTQRLFAASGIGERDFDAYLARVDAETDRRVAEGEREHLIYYALQSMRFTTRPRIEPAL